MLVSLLVPVYNEADVIEQALEEIDNALSSKQVVIVDDGSTDGTAAVVERWMAGRDGYELIRRPHAGKGAAIRAGIPHVKGEIAVIQDADLEYDPAEIPRLVEPIERGAADVVYGSRLTGGRPQRAYLFWHLVANRFLALLTGVLYNTTLSDIETGHKALRTDVLRSLDLRQDRFGIEAELTAKVLKRRLRVYELPVAYYGRTYDEGKKITWRDGVEAIWILLAARVRR